MSNDLVEVVLGSEWDQNLRERLIELLRKMGASLSAQSWGVGGSQELETLKAALGPEELEVYAETYVGLVLKGPRRIVQQLQNDLASPAGGATLGPVDP